MVVPLVLAVMGALLSGAAALERWAQAVAPPLEPLLVGEVPERR